MTKSSNWPYPRSSDAIVSADPVIGDSDDTVQERRRGGTSLGCMADHAPTTSHALMVVDPYHGLAGLRVRLDQPGREGLKVAMPTTGAFIGVPPIDPSKGALPNENTPPSVAANQ